jgi:hypothetical protein
MFPLLTTPHHITDTTLPSYILSKACIAWENQILLIAAEISLDARWIFHGSPDTLATMIFRQKQAETSPYGSLEGAKRRCGKLCSKQPKQQALWALTHCQSRARRVLNFPRALDFDFITHQSNMASLTGLPSELLARIVSFLNRPSLKAVRETSRLLSQFATPRLFDTLHLFPDEESYEAVDHIIDHATLKKMVKKVYVNTCEDDFVSPHPR